MTIERCTGPGTATFTSARYSATVDGVANYCWQWLSTQRAAYTRDVALGLQRQQTWCKWGSNQTVTLEITMLAGGPVTSYELFGAGAGVTGSIVAGKLRLVVPPFEQFRCDLNGDHQRPFYAWSSMLEDALPGGSTSWTTWRAANPAATGFPDSLKVHFTTGEYVVPELFGVGNGCTVTIQRNAVVQGSWSIEDGLGVRKQNIVFQGCGAQHMSNRDPFALGITSMDYSVARYYSVVVSPIASGASFFSENVWRGITTFAIPFHLSTGGIWSWQDCQHLSHSYGGIGDGYGCSPRIGTSEGRRVRCFIEAGDDAFDSLPFADQYDEDCVVGTTLNSCWKMLYWAYPDHASGVDSSQPLWGRLRVRNCKAYHRGAADTNTENTYPAIGDQVILKAVCDATNQQARRGWGRFDIDFDGLSVSGPVSRAVHIRNEMYPFEDPVVFGDTYDGKGNIARWKLRNVTFASTPDWKSYIAGFDEANNPHDIAMSQWRIAGELVTTANASEFFLLDRWATSIYIGGNPMALDITICNQALGLIGDAARITAVGGPDTSRQAAVCAQFYDQAVTMTLELHDWSFATRYVALVALTNDRDEWDYAYERPDDLLRPLYLLPPDQTQDYRLEPEKPIDYSFELNATGTQVIYTDLETAKLRYIAYVNEPGAWPPLFRQAVVHQLASLISGPLMRGQEGAAMAQSHAQRFASYLQAARATDAQHRQVRPPSSPSWIANR